MLFRSLSGNLNEAVANPNDAKLLSSQKLGWAAEWAVYVSLGGKDSMLNDGRLIGPYQKASPIAQRKFKTIYNEMKSAVESAMTGLDLGKANPKLPPGPGGRPVDVESNRADIHVKYNDFKRLVGFQKETGESELEENLPVEPGKKKAITPEEGFSNTSAVYDASLQDFFAEIQSEANEIAAELSKSSRALLASPRYS